MAATHRNENRAKAKVNRLKARHRAAEHRRIHTSTWLGAGALTLGVGAALASGSGIAHATTDTGTTGKTPSASTSSSTVSGSPTTPSEIGGPAKHRTPPTKPAGSPAALKHSALTSSTTGTGPVSQSAPKNLATTVKSTPSPSTAAAVTVAPLALARTTTTPTTTPTPNALIRAAVATPTTKTVALALPAAAPLNGVPIAVVVGALAVVAVATIAAPAIALLATGVVLDLTAVGGGLAIGEGVAAISYNAALTLAPPVVSDVLGLAPLTTLPATEFLGGVVSVLGALQSIYNTITGAGGSGGSGPGSGGSGPGGTGGLVPCSGASSCTTNPTNGQVTGTVSFANGTNTYTVTSGPSNGTVVVNSATGAFTYIPTEAAQLGSTPLSTDTFTETATKTGAPPSKDEITVPISGAKLEVTNTINVGSFPIGVAVSPDGSGVYVTDAASTVEGGPGHVSVINTKTGAVTTFSVGTVPFAVAVSNTGNYAYVTNEDDGTVSVIDTANDSVVTTFQVGNGNPDSCLATCVPDGPLGVATSSTGKAYVANFGGESVTAIDTATNSSGTLVSFPLPTPPSGPASIGPTGVAVTPNGQTLYVTINGDAAQPGTPPGQVEVVNTATGAITGTIQVGINPVAVAVSPTGTLAYVANQDGNAISANEDNGTVSVINTATNAVTGTINVGGVPNGVAFSPDGSLAYVTETTDTNEVAGTTVEVIDTATNAIIGTVTVGTEPWGVAVAPNGTVYVANSLGAGAANPLQGTVSVISLVQTG